KEKAKIDALQAEIDDLNETIVTELFPIENIQVKDKEQVKAIMTRYEALSDFDKQQINNYEDVEKAVAQIDSIERKRYVMISISVDTIIDNMEKLNENLRSEKYVPKDGVILEETEYVLRPKDTVFDVLLRTVRHEQIHMDYQGMDENIYNSVYIQGINHLYEF